MNASKRPSIQPYQPITLERVWGEEIFVAQTDHYLGKVLKYRKGRAGGLQYHRTKDETFYLVSGLATVEYDKDGELVREVMKPGMSFHIPPGAPHRFLALEDCVVFECSTPVYDDRVRVEEEYGVAVMGDEYGLPTT